jgi:hypothetical protein
LNSSGAIVCTYSQYALEVASALLMMKGSSNTSTRGEAAGGVARQRPDDVDHAVARLVVQLHGRAAQLHGRVGLELDAAARILFDLVHPGLVHVQPDVGRRRHEGVELERDGLLREAGEGGRPSATAAADFRRVRAGSLSVLREGTRNLHAAARRQRGFPAAPGGSLNSCNFTSHSEMAGKNSSSSVRSVSLTRKGMTPR